MLFTQQNIHHYLLRKGQLDREEIVEGGLIIADHSRRNLNFSVFRSKGTPHFFVKQLKSNDPQLVESFRREAALHFKINEEEEFSSLRQYVPECLGYDAQAELMLFEFLDTGQSLHELHLQKNVYPVEIAAALGQAMAKINFSIGTGSVPRSGAHSPFPRGKPWILFLHEMDVTPGPAVTEGSCQFARLVKSLPEMVALLNSVRASWRINAFLHNDLSWSNILRTGVQPGEIKIIDWELADFGDFAWDLGTLLQSYLTHPVLSYKVIVSQQQQTFPLWDSSFRVVYRPLRALAGAYLQTVAPDYESRLEMLQRGLQFSAARMVLTAYEAHFNSQLLLPVAQSLLQLALEVFRDSRVIAVRLASDVD